MTNITDSGALLQSTIQCLDVSLSGSAQDDKYSVNSVQHWYVALHMSPQRTLVRAGKVTLAAFVWLFSAVCFQMSPQIAGTR